MKLRIKGDSFRLRVSPTEMTRLLQSGRVAETIRFGPQPDEKLTYALLTDVDQTPSCSAMTIRYRPQEVSVLVPAEQARAWARGSQVGLYAEVNTGGAQLELAVEKDFACLDKNDEENQDTFPNPKQGAAC
jgi:hypothetical protein